jgi:putative IMPACT (imprinted ancient) family translation regulator
LQALWRLKKKEKAGRGNNTARRHTKLVTERLNASGCITSGEPKNPHNRSDIKDYGNLSNVVLENNSNLLNHNYKTKPLTKCQSATRKVNEEKKHPFH